MPAPREYSEPFKKLSLLAYIFIFSSLLAIIGYNYPSGNHSQEVPPIMAMMESGLYSRDFAIQSYLGEGPRKYYQLALATLGKSGLGLEKSYFLLYASSLLSVIIAIFKIAQLNSPKRWVNICGSGLALLGWFMFGAKGWGSELYGNTPVPSVLAMGVVIWGVYFTLRGKGMIGYLLFGVGSLIQFLVGFMAGLSFIPALILLESPQPSTPPSKSLLTNKMLPIAIWAVLLAIIYIPMHLQEKSLPPYQSTFPITYIFGNVRVPWHWLPSTASPFTWFNNLAFYVGAGWLGWKNKHKANRLLVLSLMFSMAIGVAGIAVNYFFVEVYPIELVGKLQFQRILAFSHLASYILLLGAINKMASSQPLPINKLIYLIALPFSWLYGIALFAGVVYEFILERPKSLAVASRAKIYGLMYALFITVLVASHFYRINGRAALFSSIQIAAFIFIAICVLLSLALAKTRKGGSSHLTLYFLAPLSSIFLMALVLASSTDNSRIGDLSRIAMKTSRPQLKTEEYVLAKLFESKSNKDDLILIPPMGDFQFFAYDSRRSVVFSWKNVPYNDSSIQEWGRRLQDITGIMPYRGINEDLERLYCKRSKNDLIGVAKAYDAQYIVLKSECHGGGKPVNKKILAESGGYYIEEI